MDDATQTLEEVLEREYDALRNGDLSELSELAEAKQRALDSLPEYSPDLDRLSQQTARNAALIKAAMSGVAAARERLTGRDVGGAPLETYGSDGRKQRVRTAPPTLEKRR